MKDALAMVDLISQDGPVILVASSNGGWVSTYVASVRPEKIVGLVLIGKFKGSLPHAFSTCVYCMLLRFQRNYFGSNRRNYFENTNAFSKHISYNKILKTLQCVRDLDMLYLGKLGGGGSVLGLSLFCYCRSFLKK